MIVLSGSQCDNFVARLEVHDMSNKATVNSLQTYDLGEGVLVKVETQTGLCNVTAFKKTLNAKKADKAKFQRWLALNATQVLIKEFEEKHKGEQVRVFSKGNTRLLDVKAHILIGTAPNQILWLHKELMPFYVNWVGAGDKVLKFTSEVFATKAAFLRDQSTSLELTFRELLEHLKYDKEGSKLIFGFTKDGENRWDQASTEQLMARILILTQYIEMLKTKSYTSWDEIRVDMNNYGNRLWFLLGW
jgi:hypothetical protein